MPKPKVVTKPRPVSIPSSRATRDLNTVELASNWQDKHGMISVDEGQKRVFEAATEAGIFTVCTRGTRAGEIERTEHRSFAAALPVFVHLSVQQRRPMLYAAVGPNKEILNRDTLIAPAKAYKNEDGRFIAANDATADVLHIAYVHWCKLKGYTPHEQIVRIINILRTKRRIVRERLPTKPKRERL